VGDPYNLQRFVDAQWNGYGDVVRQLRDGRKTTHWMWFIFPQLQGLRPHPDRRALRDRFAG
jgi:uncharacterized protein (DUF1810 family)